MIKLTEDQRKELERLWFIYGNSGLRSTKGNHGYIQGFLEFQEDRKDFYLQGIENMRDRGESEERIKKMAITPECIEAVEKVIYS